MLHNFCLILFSALRSIAEHSVEPCGMGHFYYAADYFHWLVLMVLNLVASIIPRERCEFRTITPCGLAVSGYIIWRASRENFATFGKFDANRPRRFR